MLRKFNLIQEAIENQNEIGSFKKEIRDLNEKYEIEQESFGIVSGKPSKIHSGYMKVTGEYGTLEEALKDFKELNDILYIVDSKSFVLGKYSFVIGEKKEDEKTVDLSTLKFI